MRDVSGMEDEGMWPLPRDQTISAVNRQSITGHETRSLRLVQTTEMTDC